MNSLLNRSVGFIGMGNMGTALYKGIISDSSITVRTYDKFKPCVEDGSAVPSADDIARTCKYILLAVKPQQVEEVLSKIVSDLTTESVIISICAGISAEFIRSRTSQSQKVISVMPNTPMMLGEGASAISTDELTSSEELDFACSVIGSCSPTVELIPPDKMNEVICINGSSPAFIYLFAKCFIDYASENEIDETAALNLFSQTLIGSAKMLTESGLSANQLISQVSSKGGTTLAGLEQLHNKGLPEAVRSACEACTERAYELGELKS